jgi:hypothetical protein
MRKTRLLGRLILGALALMMLVLPQAVSAASMTWRLKSFDKYAVDVSFYSQNRKHIWPGGDEVYVIRDYETKSYSIKCIEGEKVCYGAWVRGSSKEYWGAGSGGKRACKSCCYTCEDGFQTPILNLNSN